MHASSLYSQRLCDISKAYGVSTQAVDLMVKRTIRSKFMPALKKLAPDLFDVAASAGLSDYEIAWACIGLYDRFFQHEQISLEDRVLSFLKTNGGKPLHVIENIFEVRLKPCINRLEKEGKIHAKGFPSRKIYCYGAKPPEDTRSKKIDMNVCSELADKFLKSVISNDFKPENGLWIGSDGVLFINIIIAAKAAGVSLHKSFNLLAKGLKNHPAYMRRRKTNIFTGKTANAWCFDLKILGIK